MRATTLDVAISGREARWALLIVALLTYVVLSGGSLLIAAAAAGLVLAVGALFLFHSMVQGNADPMLLLWLPLFPFGYYFLSFPARDHAIITWDRLILVALIVGALLAPATKSLKIPMAVRRSGAMWVAFIAAAAISLVKADDRSTPAKLIFDSFLLPMLFGWYVVRNYDVRRHARAIHMLLCLSVMCSCAIGVAENILQKDLMPFEGGVVSGIALDNAPDTSLLLRGNGPFAAAHTFSLVGQVSLILLLFLHRAIPNMGTVHRALHVMGTMAALLQTLLPLGRAVYLSLIVLVVLDAAYVSSPFKKAIRFSVVPAAIVFLLILKAVVPSVFEERSKSDNALQRVAQQFQTLKIFASSPLIGVGLQNFLPMAETRRFDVNVEGFIPADSPHNNFGLILAETGLLGFFPYVAAQVLLVIAFVRLRCTASGELAWKYFLYLFLSYTLIGLTVSHGVYREINIIYVFAIAVMYKYIVTEAGA